VHRINQTRPDHIVTIEDPIEFTHQDIKSRVTQREVGADTSAFDRALRQVVRQSPDVIVIGEMRDRDTVETALSAALTGHLVLSTLHTIDATQTLQRILSFFPADQREQAAVDLSMSLCGVVSQRLVPRADGKGRAIAAELLTVTPGVRRLIRDQQAQDLTDFMKHASGSGEHQTFNASLLALHQAGTIGYDVGVAYSSNADEFALSARGMSTTSVGERPTGEDMIGGGLDIKALLDLAVARGASDLHVTEGRPPVYRISGGLHPLGSRLLTEHDMRVLLFSILTSHQRSQFELDREIDFALAVDERHRFRVNAYYQRGRMAASLRSIATEIPDAEALGLPSALLSMAKRGHGLMLVVGPTGSGKSTTLACLVDGINRERACRILTVEDPIEFTHTSIKATIDQREVGPDTRSFAAALKYVLRQDPDVIMIGEMRDTETISAALTAAETGHLVLATLHTNDAIQAIDRIIDAFPSSQQSQVRAMLSASLLGVVSQRLLPRVDTVGRVAAFEVLVATPAIRNLIREHKLHQMYSTMETSLGTGMVTMDRSLGALVKAGIVRYEDAALQAKSPRSLPGSPPVT
jgi:pilus retraction protein PilT